MRPGRALIAAAGVLIATAGCAHFTTNANARDPRVVHEVQSRYTVQMVGMVTYVNARAGQLTLKNADGAMTLRFPSEALLGVQVGDHVVLAAGLLNVGSNPSASPRMEEEDEADSPAERPPTYR